MVKGRKKNQKITIDDFKISSNEAFDYVEWKEIERMLGKTRYKKFCKFMNGQTCFEGGAYVCDVENFLRKVEDRFFD
jgi:hypothetical protein